MNLCDPCETAGTCIKRGECIFENPRARARFADFDEWYEATYGQSFDGRWMAHGVPIASAMRALSIAMREYTTEMVRAAHEGRAA